MRAARIARSLLTSTIALAAWVVPAAGQEELTAVSIVVNVLKGAAPVTDQQIKDAIAEANKILKPAGVELVHAKTNTNVSDEGDDDGKVSPEEAKKLREKGKQELDNVVKKGKALKWYISRLCDTSDPLAIGQTLHNDPVAITEHPPEKEDFGWVLAHEFSHSFTNSGHRDPDGALWGEEYLMHWKFGKGGTKLSDAQKAEIKKKADEQGTTKKQDTPSAPPEKKSQSRASGSDYKSGENGEMPGIPPDSDLQRSEMFWDQTSGMMRGSIRVQEMFDPYALTQSQCLEYLDTDANSVTGQHVVVDGRPLGAEYRIEISVYGGAGTLQLQGFVFNTANGQYVPLNPLQLVTQDLHVCDGDEPSVVPMLDEILFEFPRSFMGTLASPSPVGVKLTDFIAGTTDECSMDLQNHPAANPTVTLSSYLVTPGQAITVFGSGFTPGASVTIYADDAVVTTVMASGEGASAPGSALRWWDAPITGSTLASRTAGHGTSAS